jgi:Stage II sporulation protein E (SpoIIE)/GAF domain
MNDEPVGPRSSRAPGPASSAAGRSRRRRVTPDERSRLFEHQPPAAVMIVVTMALQVAFMVLLGSLPGSRLQELGLPGAIAVLLSVIAAVLTGPWGGVAVATVGSAAFLVFVSEDAFGWPTVAAVVLWILAALIAGLAARALRAQVRRREDRLADRQRLEQALNVMGGLLTSSLDSDEILDRAVRLATEELPCDATAIVLREKEEWRPLVAWNMPASFMARSFTPAGAPSLERAFREGRPVQAPEDPVRPDARGSLRQELGLATSLVTALTVHGVREGVLIFSFLGERHRFTEIERMFAVRLASRLGQALDNARLYERLSDVAVTLQTSLARSAPTVEGVSVDLYRRVAYSPHLVGGDFADVFRAGQSIDVVIGDVEGKGVGASALAETVRSGIRAVATLHESPAFVLGHLNRVLRDERATQFCTVLLLRLDPLTGAAIVASAGHPAPLCAGPRGVRLIEPVYGPPLGTFEYEYEEITAAFDPDEVLLLYTDGLTEARGTDGSLFGEERVLGVLREAAPANAKAATEALRAAVERFAPDLRDDLQLLAVSFAGDRGRDGARSGA